MRLAVDAAHEFGGVELDRSKPLNFRLDGRRFGGFAGDTVLSAVLAAGIDTYGRLGEVPLRLGERFAPAVLPRRDAGGAAAAVPMSRMPAIDGLDLVTVGPRSSARLGALLGARGHSLRHRLDARGLPGWQDAAPAETRETDLLVIGGGVAGLAAADAAAIAGHSVVLVERRPWLGGDARYFGAVGDEESPATLATRLAARLAGAPGVTVLTCGEAFAMQPGLVLVHHFDTTGAPAGRIIAIAASRILLATGATQRLPVFAGNRLPGVGGAIEVHHLAERYGVARGRSAIVATQSNFGYRLALRLHDAGVAIRRVVDTRVNPQSRFVDFAKASGLTLGGGQVPVSASLTATRGVHAGFANAGTSQVALNLEAEQLVVSGSFQPALRLWMLAGGATDWRHGRLEAAGHVERLALAGAAAGYRSMTACAESGRQAQALLFGGTPRTVEDREIDPMYETPDGTTAISPAWTGTAFLDAGASLVMRPAAAGAALAEVAALSLADVAASVDLGLIATTDAGAVAEERGAPGADLAASSWRPAPLAAPESSAWLAGRFGAEPVRVHLIVDGRRTFEIGALVYANTSPPDPARAIGVIVAAAPEGKAGGIALLQKSAAGRKLRFVVETMRGPSPARPATD